MGDRQTEGTRLVKGRQPDTKGTVLCPLFPYISLPGSGCLSQCLHLFLHLKTHRFPKRARQCHNCTPPAQHATINPSKYPKVTSTFFKCCQLKRRTQVQLHNVGSQRLKITLLFTQKHNISPYFTKGKNNPIIHCAWRCQKPFLKGPCERDSEDGTSSNHQSLLKRKPGKMARGTLRCSELSLSSTLIPDTSTPLHCSRGRASFGRPVSWHLAYTGHQVGPP